MDKKGGRWQFWIRMEVGGLGAEHSAEVKPKKCETSVCVCRSTGTGAYVAAGKSCTFSVVKGGGWHFWIRRRVALLDKEVEEQQRAERLCLGQQRQAGSKRVAQSDGSIRTL